MFKCPHCKKVSERGETPFTRTKYYYEKNQFGKLVRGNIVRIEKNNCYKCFKKLGAEIK